MGDQVTLDVGGQTFKTSLATVTRDPNSLLAKIALHDFADGQRSAFIDRDGSTFRYILNYLRDGDCILPDDEQGRQELRREAEFFQVQGLIDLLSDNSVPAAADLAGLSHLQHDKQEAILIDKLRQEAGPSLIAQAEKAVIEAAYSVERVGSSESGIPPTERDMLGEGYNITWNLSHRQPSLRQLYLPKVPLTVPETGRVNSLQHFVERYIDVIKFDLRNLGYSITHNTYTDTIALNSSALEDFTSAVLTDTPHGLTVKTTETY